MFTVTSDGDITDPDDGVLTLREAIENANATPDTDTIAFNINGGGAQTIKLVSGLPSITETVIIDGPTQPEPDGTPLITIDASAVDPSVVYTVLGVAGNAGGSELRDFQIVNAAYVALGLAPSADGNIVENLTLVGRSSVYNDQALRISSSGNEVHGVTASGWDTGISISGGTGNTIRDSFVLESTYGIFLTATDNNTVEGNTVSGSDSVGIYLYDAPTVEGKLPDNPTSDNIIQNNIASGANTGIFGQTFDGLHNQYVNNDVSSSGYFGIAIINDVEFVLGGNNYTDSAGGLQLRNMNGLTLDSTRLPEVLTTAGTSGPALQLTNMTNTTVDGLDLSWDGDGQQGKGLVISGGSGNTITGVTATDRAFGIYVSSSDWNKILKCVANQVASTGITLQAGSQYNILDGNVVSNSKTGISVDASSENTIHDNNASQSTYGIWVASSDNNTVDDNIVEDAVKYGIILTGTSSGNTISANHAARSYVGISGTGLGNKYFNNDVSSTTIYGIVIKHDEEFVLNGNDFTNSNTGLYLGDMDDIVLDPGRIGDNAATLKTAGLVGWGHALELRRVTNSTISGLDLSAPSGANTAGAGVAIIGSSGNTIQNVTVSNRGYGVYMINLGTFNSDDNSIVDCPMTANNFGIYLYDSSSNTIARNDVSGSSGTGIRVAGGSGNRIQGNSIHSNGGLGIDLGTDFKVTPNDTGDADTGANNLQNFPVLSALKTGSITRVAGTLDSTPSTTFTLDFYANSEADPSGYGEGERWLGAITVTTDADGDADFDTVLPAATTPGEVITATATEDLAEILVDPGTPDDPTDDYMIHPGNTSEFSAAIGLPVAEDDAYQMYGTSLTVAAADGVLSNDTGGVLESLSAVLQDPPTEGTVTLNEDGSFTYTLGEDFDGVDTFTYVAQNEVGGQSNVATVTITNMLYVRNTNDNGEGSLRWAMTNANSHANDPSGPDTIVFAIPGEGPHTIQPVSSLPYITDPVVIDGYTQPGSVANTNGPDSGLNTVLMVELDGSQAQSWAYGLRISAGNSTVRGLAINRFGTGGVALHENGGNVIAGNFIGTDITGTSALGNGMYGIAVYGGSQSNVIGTNGDGADDAAERNVISGNGWFGVSIWNAGTAFNSVAGNLIGTDVSGLDALPNGPEGDWSCGVSLGAGSNRIGTDGDGLADAMERNIISGNVGSGIYMANTGTDFNVIAGNYIGTDVTGAAAVPNTGPGIHLNGYGGGPKWNRIGTDGNALPDGSDDPNNEHERNIISGNAHVGVLLLGAGVDENTVAGNYVGTDATGTAAVPNGYTGVWLRDSAQSNVIGTDGDGIADAAERNLISGNAHAGVEIWHAGTAFNSVAGNFIGTDVTGTEALGNGEGPGVLILFGAQSNRIGTDGNGVADAAERNVISGNVTNGVNISGEGCAYNVVAGNYIGTDVTGTDPLGNGSVGMRLADGARANRVGTDGNGVADDAERNVISGNGVEGVLLVGPGTDQNLVAGNYIGTDVFGSEPLRNSWRAPGWRGAVDVWGDARFNRIEGNVISGNKRHGVQVRNGASHNVVVGNFIGTDATGNVAMGNGGPGVNLVDTFYNRVGPLTAPATAAVPPTLNYDASMDNDGDANWQDTIGTVDTNAGSDTDFHLALDTSVTRVEYESPPLSGISAAYSFDGNGGGAESSLRYIAGDPSNTNASWEIWFKPVGDADVDVLFESGGGGDGVSIRYDGANNEALFTVDDSAVQRTVQGGAVLIDTSEFNQLVAVYDKNVDADGNDVLRLYVNGQLVDDSTDNPTTALNDWAGSDWTGVARIGSGVAQTGWGTAYEGEISIIRFYESALLDYDVQAGFLSVGGPVDQPNTIAFNGTDGVSVRADATSGNVIRGNRIYENGGLGIDLDPDGVTLNDPGDVDTGPNNLQNFPVISFVESGTVTRVVGTLNSTPDSTFALDFYANTTADPSGYGEGERWLDSAIVTTDVDGNASFDVVLTAATVSGESITATATDTEGNTSEFSSADVLARIPVQIDVKPGSDTNPINLNSISDAKKKPSNGVVPVTLFTTADFDASTVDVTTVYWAGAGVHHSSLEDVDGDGDLDLVLNFRLADTDLLDAYRGLIDADLSDDGVLNADHWTVSTELTGETNDGSYILGADEVDLFMSGKALRDLLDSL